MSWCGWWEGGWFVVFGGAWLGYGDGGYGTCRRGVGEVWREGEVGECEVGWSLGIRCGIHDGRVDLAYHLGSLDCFGFEDHRWVSCVTW